MMNISELADNIGKIVLYKVITGEAESVIKKPKLKPCMFVKVRIIDVKTSYGHILYKIEAVAGKGAVWVRDSSLQFLKGANNA